MFSIRTTLVAAAFIAMGLTSAAEYLAGIVAADPEPFVSVDAEQSMPGKALQLTQISPAVPAELDLSPWI